MGSPLRGVHRLFNFIYSGSKRGAGEQRISLANAIPFTCVTNESLFPHMPKNRRAGGGRWTWGGASPPPASRYIFRWMSRTENFFQFGPRAGVGGSSPPQGVGPLGPPPESGVSLFSAQSAQILLNPIIDPPKSGSIQPPQGAWGWVGSGPPLTPGIPPLLQRNWPTVPSGPAEPLNGPGSAIPLTLLFGVTCRRRRAACGVGRRSPGFSAAGSNPALRVALLPPAPYRQFRAIPPSPWL